MLDTNTPQRRFKVALSVIVTGSLVGLALTGCTSGAKRTPPMVVDDQTTAYVESARADLRERKVQVLEEAMQLEPSEHDRFWHEYYQYENELKVWNDKKLALIRDYAYSYDRMDDRTADDLARRALEITQGTLDLRKKYYGRIKSATSAATAARFLQAEHQINLLFDLETATRLPLLTKD